MTKYIIQPLYIILLLNIVMNVMVPTCPAGSHPSTISWRKTVSLYQRNDCLTSKQVEYGKEVIKGLNYNAQRVVRVFSTKFTPNFSDFQNIWSLLINNPMSYQQRLCFEQWSKLPNIDLELAVKGMKNIAALSTPAGLSFQNILQIQDVTASIALTFIPQLNNLQDVTNTCLQSICLIDDITIKKVTAAFPAINRFTDNQALAAKQYAELPTIIAQTFLKSLAFINRLEKQDAWNFYSLLKNKHISKKEAWQYLISFFSLPRHDQEIQYQDFSNEQKEKLLAAMHTGGYLLIRKINNLHSITDRFGTELSPVDRQRLSLADLETIFNGFSGSTQSKYRTKFTAAKKQHHKHTMMKLLQEATTQERFFIAQTITSANNYALMAQGSELYSSSFREILTPTLHSHIDTNYNGNLYDFLQQTDPSNLLTAQFIISCVQKGVLHTFFPENSGVQKLVLDMVFESAFKNEQTILLFSASILSLVKVLQPDAKNYFAYKMIEMTKQNSKKVSKLADVMLQYLIKYQPTLFSNQLVTKSGLSKQEKSKINFDRFYDTPFSQWISDNNLGSLSIFHPDDDGKKSFYSFAKLLSKKGYVLHASKNYNGGTLPSQELEKLQVLLNNKQQVTADNFEKIFLLMQKENVCITYSKKINNILIQHTLSIYSSPNNQYQNLYHFLTTGEEMLSQRGHSYWREQQIMSPLKELAKKGLLTRKDNQHFFISIGSCGGIQDYSELYTSLNGSVDIFATAGTGFTSVNNTYNTTLFELIAKSSGPLSWNDVEKAFAPILNNAHDYVQPGSLTSILHKIYMEETRFAYSEN